MNIDLVKNPPHYKSHPSGIECIAIAEKMNFCLGNAFKYAFRCSMKGTPVQDLQKCQWYLQRELANRANKREWWLTRHRASKYDPFYDGSHDIVEVLSFEARYFGHMVALLAEIYTAHIFPRDKQALELALGHLYTMLYLHATHP